MSLNGQENTKLVVVINVGGTVYATTLATLIKEPNSALASSFGEKRENKVASLQNDGSYFIDRDGQLFRFVLDYLRTGKIVLPEPFVEISRLREEAKFYDLKGLMKQLKIESNNEQINPLDKVNGSLEGQAGYISVGYRGTFAFGRDGQADVKFRKLNRILVCGKATLCREVFGDSLNESRNPNQESAEQYSARLYLKHQNIEKACDTLASKGFHMVGMATSGANGPSAIEPRMCSSMSKAESTLVKTWQNHINLRSSGDYEEQRWLRYTEFMFCKETSVKPG